MPIQPTTVTHTQSFDVYNSAEDANIAAAEFFEGNIWAMERRFEGYLFRNTFIASGDARGGVIEGLDYSQVNNSNPAGTFRSLVNPLGETSEFKSISSLGDIRFDSYGADQIMLEINTYLKSGIERVYPVDSGGWLVSKIESAMTGKATTALVKEINYHTYRVLKAGALNQIDYELGAQGRIVKAPTDTKAFTDGIIDQIASLEALPYDRYNPGINEEELVIMITPKGHAKILKEKLQIFDGSKFSFGDIEDGHFFTGLPYTHLFAGVRLVKTKWMNDKSTVPQFEYIGLPAGKWSPFLMELNRFKGYAERVNFTDGSIGVYATALYGLKVETKFDQYIFAGTVDDPTPQFVDSNLIAPKALPGTVAGTIQLSYDEEKTTGDVLFKVSKDGKPVDGYSSYVKLDTNVDSGNSLLALTSDTLYTVHFASAKTGETVPNTSLDQNSVFVLPINVKTK